MDARERFERTRKAVKRLAEVQALIMYDCDDWHPPGVKAHNETSDPTAKRAIYNVDELAEKLTALRAEERELIQLIGESGTIIEAVKSGFIDKYGYVLEWRYIDCETWASIADAYDVTERTVQNWAQWACEWIDSVGVSRLLRGEVEV